MECGAGISKNCSRRQDPDTPGAGEGRYPRRTEIDTRGAKKGPSQGAGSAEGRFSHRAPTTQSTSALHKATLPPGRRNGISTLSSGGLGPPTPAQAPPHDVLDRDSQLARGMSANSGWLKWSHEGTVVAFPEGITGQAQSFASVSSSSW